MRFDGLGVSVTSLRFVGKAQRARARLLAAAAAKRQQAGDAPALVEVAEDDDEPAAVAGGVVEKAVEVSAGGSGMQVLRFVGRMQRGRRQRVVEAHRIRAVEAARSRWRAGVGAARTSVILSGIATGKREERDAEEAEAEKRLTDVERRRRRKITHHATQLTSVTDILRINICKEQLAEALKGELPVLEIQVLPP
jgi:hypothetical protein